MMNVSWVFWMSLGLCHCASVYNKQETTLDLVQNDIAKINGAIEDITFDVLRKVFEDFADSAEDEATTQASQSLRPKRTTVDDVRDLCQNHCEESVKTEQINEVRSKVTTLQDLVRNLNGQQRLIISVEKNSSQRAVGPEATNTQQLDEITTDLDELIGELNQTRDFIKLQNEKDAILERDLIAQKEELQELKETLAPEPGTTTESRLRDAAPPGDNDTIDDIDDNIDDDTMIEGVKDENELRLKILSLEHALAQQKSAKKLQETHFERDLLEIQRTLEEKKTNKGLVLQVIEALRKSGPRPQTKYIKKHGTKVEASDKLPAKESVNPPQIPEALKKGRQSSRTSQGEFGVSPEQVEVSDMMADKHPESYVCVEDAGKRQYPPVYQQFLPRQYSVPSYTPEGTPPLAYPEHQYFNQRVASGPNQRQSDDLQRQINQLQVAIDSFSKPEFLQRPEDQTVLKNLNQQIAELRSLVASTQFKRSKRDTTDVPMGLDEIQNQINTIKNQLDTGGSARSADASYGSYHADYPGATKIKSAHNDVFVELVGNILDKIIASIPTVLQRLFNLSIDEYGYGDYELQNVFKNMGVFGYLPIILVRILSGVGSFFKLLRKNAFVRRFAMPAMVLGGVAGSVLFLIWWLQADDDYSQYDNGYGNYDQKDTNIQNGYNVQYSATSAPRAAYGKSYYSYTK